MPETRLLIVDDDAVIGRFVASVGAVCGYEVRSVFRADDFLTELDAWAPSHIAIDLKTPDCDGIALLQRLAERRCTARMLLISDVEARSIDSVRRLGGESGLDIAAILRKPLRAKTLQTVLADLRRDPGTIDGDAVGAAIARGELDLMFQPKILLGETRSRGGSWRTAGFETLLRWHHPTRGLLTANDFLPQVKAADRMLEITELVFDRLLVQQRQWSERGLRTTFSFNLPPAALASRTLADELTRRCEEARVRPEDLIVELPESAATADAIATLDLVSRLRIKGFHLSVDGFRGGIGGLTQLGRMPFSEVKLDPRLVAECTVSEQSRASVAKLTDLAHRLGLSVVALGIETDATLKLAEELGCDVAQGYQIAYPLEAERAARWLACG